MSRFDPTIGTCRLDLEDRALLSTLPPMPPRTSDFQRPERVAVDWHRHEDQGQLGSCQGNDLTSCLERLHFVATRSRVQLSRIFAYLATQQVDGLLGSDRGSTITGGAKVAMESGVPPEARTGYPSRYPDGREIQQILSAENYAAGRPFRAASQWAVSSGVEEAMDWIGGGGAISIGIAWYAGIIPQDRIIRRFQPSRRFGGHAVAVLGYEQDRLTAVNSHGDGPFQITAAAWQQMHAHPDTAMVGLAGSLDAKPINWTHEAPWS